MRAPSTLITTTALCIIGILSVGHVQAAARVGTGTFDTTPAFLKRAEIALEQGRLDRAVGLILPRMGLLRRAADQHLAQATLCAAQLRLENFSMAGEPCTAAAESKLADWSDLNNLGAYHYATGDFDSALSWFERAGQKSPKREAVKLNIEAAMAATQR